jgi:hypothetical protein
MPKEGLAVLLEYSDAGEANASVDVVEGDPAAPGMTRFG